MIEIRIVLTYVREKVSMIISFLLKFLYIYVCQILGLFSQKDWRHTSLLPVQCSGNDTAKNFPSLIIIVRHGTQKSKPLAFRVRQSSDTP